MTERTYRHFLFDFDGVLCDSLAVAIDAFNTIRLDRFPQLPPVRSRDDMTVVYSGPLRSALTEWLTEEESREFFDLHSALMRSRTAELMPFPGSATMLKELGRESVSIVTSAYSDAVRRVLGAGDDFEPRSLFRIAGRELRQTKTQKIREILEAAEINFDDAVYIGDLESDILYSENVPIDIIAVGYGYHPPWYLRDKGATFFAESFADLRALLASLKRRSQGVRTSHGG